jgi:hypothetical protein
MSSLFALSIPYVKVVLPFFATSRTSRSYATLSVVLG